MDVAALVRATWRLGLVGRERLPYWRLLVWSLVRRPRTFSMAVTLAIYGYI